MNSVFFVLILIAMLMTLAVLFAGLLTMAKGGEFNRKHGNRLMRWRVIMQGIALALLALAFLAGRE